MVSFESDVESTARQTRRGWFWHASFLLVRNWETERQKRAGGMADVLGSLPRDGQDEGDRTEED